jgi:hypothetical protein
VCHCQPRPGTIVNATFVDVAAANEGEARHERAPARTGRVDDDATYRHMHRLRSLEADGYCSAALPRRRARRQSIRPVARSEPKKSRRILLPSPTLSMHTPKDRLPAVPQRGLKPTA